MDSTEEKQLKKLINGEILFVRELSSMLKATNTKSLSASKKARMRRLLDYCETVEKLLTRKEASETLLQSLVELNDKFTPLMGAVKGTGGN